MIWTTHQTTLYLNGVEWLITLAVRDGKVKVSGASVNGEDLWPTMTDAGREAITTAAVADYKEVKEKV